MEPPDARKKLLPKITRFCLNRTEAEKMQFENFFNRVMKEVKEVHPSQTLVIDGGKFYMVSPRKSDRRVPVSEQPSQPWKPQPKRRKTTRQTLNNEQPLLTLNNEQPLTNNEENGDESTQRRSRKRKRNNEQPLQTSNNEQPFTTNEENDDDSGPHHEQPLRTNEENDDEPGDEQNDNVPHNEQPLTTNEENDGESGPHNEQPLTTNEENDDESGPHNEQPLTTNEENDDEPGDEQNNNVPHNEQPLTTNEENDDESGPHNEQPHTTNEKNDDESGDEQNDDVPHNEQPLTTNEENDSYSRRLNRERKRNNEQPLLTTNNEQPLTTNEENDDESRNEQNVNVPPHVTGTSYSGRRNRKRERNISQRILSKAAELKDVINSILVKEATDFICVQGILKAFMDELPTEKYPMLKDDLKEKVARYAREHYNVHSPLFKDELVNPLESIGGGLQFNIQTAKQQGGYFFTSTRCCKDLDLKKLMELKQELKQELNQLRSER